MDDPNKNIFEEFEGATQEMKRESQIKKEKFQSVGKVFGSILGFLFIAAAVFVVFYSGRTMEWELFAGTIIIILVFTSLKIFIDKKLKQDENNKLAGHIIQIILTMVMLLSITAYFQFVK